jgi:hypothetical protein
MTNPLHSSPETTTPPETASEPWTPPELQKLPVAETANTGSQNGDDGVFFS